MDKPFEVKLMQKNYDYLTVKTFPEVCRVCLAKRDVLKPFTDINFKHNINVNGIPECVTLTNFVEQFCNITFSSMDQKPQNVCEICIDMAAKAYGFFQLCTYSNTVLENKLEEENAVESKENILSEIFMIEEYSPEAFIIDANDDFDFIKPFPLVEEEPREKLSLDLNQALELKNVPFYVFPEIEEGETSVKVSPEVPLVLTDHNYSKIDISKIRPYVKYKAPKERKPRIRVRVKKPPKQKAPVEKRILMCKLCKTIEFEAAEQVLEHIEEYHNTHFKCIICNLPLKRHDARKFHISCHFSDKFPCKRCQIIFDSPEELKTHEATKEHIHRKMCHICGKVFSKVARKIHHINTVHNDSKNYQCAKCGSTFSTSANLRRHELRHEQPKRFLCQECGKALSTNSILRIHLQKVHNIDQGVSLESLKRAQRTYQQKRNMRKALTRKPRKAPNRFECPICSIKFLSYPMYLTHCSSHPEVTEFPCDECDAQFTSVEEYLEHEKIHEKYACSVCGMTFKAKAMMYNHKYTQHGPPVKCSVCNKDFRQKCRLKLHMLTHTKEKPHVCELCGLSYRQTTSLRAHMFGAHGSKPFECHLCDKKFMYNTELRGHIRVHTGERPFVCLYCDKAFRDTVSRHKHVKQEHSERMEEFLTYKEIYQAAEVKRAEVEC